jgi:hypothetical protein
MNSEEREIVTGTLLNSTAQRIRESPKLSNIMKANKI